MTRLVERFKTCPKPVIGCFLGTRIETQFAASNFQSVTTIDAAVRLSIKTVSKDTFFGEEKFTSEESEWLACEKASWNSEQKYLRGLFAGGTFCYQAQQIMQDAGITIRSNAPLEPKINCKIPITALHTRW